MLLGLYTLCVRADYPQKIVSLAPHITEILFEVGAAKQIQATVDASDFPAAAKQVPRIGRFDSINLERLVALKPDLVIAWRYGLSAKQEARIRQLGLPLYIDSASQLGDIATSYKNIARLSGHNETGEQLATNFAMQLQQLAQAAGTGNKPVKVFYQIWHDPLISINKHHYIAEIIHLCGGENIIADSISLSPTVSLESVINAQPALIIITADPTTQQAAAARWQNQSVRQLSGIRAIRFFGQDSPSRPTLSVLPAARKICAWIKETATSTAP